MLGDHPFSSWSQIIVGGICFALIFESPLILADYLTEGALGLTWQTIAFGAAAFLGYAGVGGAIMKWSSSSTSQPPR